MIRALGILTLVTLLGAAACGDEGPPPPPPTYQFTVEVQVEDSNQNPVPKVPVLLDGKVVGYTDRDGKFSGTLTDRADKELTLSVNDVEGFRFAADSNSVTETLKITKVNGQDSGVPIFLQVQAESIKKDYFVWIKAVCDDSLPTCAGMPVTLNGREVAKTNHLGYAHFSFKDVPQNDVEIKIDTPSHSPSDKDSARYEPRDPSYKLTLDLESHIYLVEENFTNPEKPKKKRVNRRKSNRRPNRKKTQQKKPEPKPEPAGGINLFD